MGRCPVVNLGGNNGMKSTDPNSKALTGVKYMYYAIYKKVGAFAQVFTTKCSDFFELES